MKTDIKQQKNQQFTGRPYYEIDELLAMSDETLLDYIIFTMQRKSMTEFIITTLLTGCLGVTYDRPQGWHLLFWPFLGGYRHTYQWERVFIDNGQLICEFKEEIWKSAYDLFEDTFLEKIFPSPAGQTVGERWYPKKITHYTADEFFAMQHHLPKNIERLDKHRELADLAFGVQYYNPLRKAAEEARRPKMTLEQAKLLIDVPYFKYGGLTENGCHGPKKKFSQRLLVILLISVVVSIPVGIFLHYCQYQVEAQFGFSWLVATLIFFGMWFGISLLIDLLSQLN